MNSMLPTSDAAPFPVYLARHHAKLNCHFACYTRDNATGLDYADQRYYSRTIGRFTRPDPYRGSASATNPQSWNRYAYVGNDPVNYLDQSGTCGEPASFGQGGDTITVDVYIPCPDGPGSGGGTHLRPVRVPEGWNTADPAPPSLTNYADSKRSLQDAVNRGAISDCHALATYASIAFQHGSPAAVSDALAEFVDAGNANVQRLGLPARSNAPYDRLLDSMSPNVSGFLPQYQDVLGPHEDQVHHFAAFFELGYIYGSTDGTGSVAGLLAALKTDNIFTNPGDVYLGNAAAQIGESLTPNPYLAPVDPYDSINQLCDPNWQPRS